jgi:hypothetical protein
MAIARGILAAAMALAPVLDTAKLTVFRGSNIVADIVRAAATASRQIHR